MNTKLICCIDWLSFTFPIEYCLSDCLKYLGFDLSEFVFMEGGASGYSRRCRHSIYNIWFLWSGNENMGVHVDCSGGAVQFMIDTVIHKPVITPFGDGCLVEDFNETDLQMFFKLLSPVVKFSRIDLAIDDTTGKYYSLFDLHEIGENRNYITLFKKWREVFTKDTNSGECVGYTIYMGSRESDFFIRVYDKRLEQISKGVDVPYDTWVRWEMEIKHENANLVAQKLSNYCDFHELVFRLLTRYIRIIDLTSNARKCRCKNMPLWDSFTGSVSQMRLVRNDDNIDIIERKKNWLKNSVAKSLAMCVAGDGGDDKLIYDMLSYGKNKFTSNDYQIIKEKLSM